jgi:hypothetical protein
LDSKDCLTLVLKVISKNLSSGERLLVLTEITTLLWELPTVINMNSLKNVSSGLYLLTSSSKLSLNLMLFIKKLMLPKRLNLLTLKLNMTLLRELLKRLKKFKMKLIKKNSGKELTASPACSWETPHKFLSRLKIPHLLLSRKLLKRLDYKN